MTKTEYSNHEMYTVYIDSGELDKKWHIQQFNKWLEDNGYLVKKAMIRIYFCCDHWYHGLLENCPKCGTHWNELPKDADHAKRVADACSEMGKWAIEFKWSEKDFWRSLTGKYLYDQIEYGAAVYGNHYSMAIAGYESSVVMDHPERENWIRSIQPKAFHQYGIGFKWCEDVEGAFKYFESQRKQAYGKYKTHRRKRRIGTKCRQVDAIATTPDIGVKISKEMLIAYGSARKVVNLTHSQVSAFPRVGDKKAMKFVDFWNEDVRMKILDEETEKGEMENE